MYTCYPPKAASPSLGNLYPYSRGTSSLRSSISRGTYTPGSYIVFNSSDSSVIDQQIKMSAQISEFQAQLRKRWPTVLAEAKELAKLYPDPIQGMVSLLGELPGDYKTQREIIEEPYG